MQLISILSIIAISVHAMDMIEVTTPLVSSPDSPLEKFAFVVAVQKSLRESWRECKRHLHAGTPEDLEAVRFAIEEIHDKMKASPYPLTQGLRSLAEQLGYVSDTQAMEAHMVALKDEIWDYKIWIAENHFGFSSSEDD